MADNECQLQTFLFKQTSRCSLRARPRPIAPITTAWQDHCQHCISFQLLTTTFWGEFFARWWRWLVHPQRSFGVSDIGTSWRLSTVTATTTTTTTTAMTTTALTSCWQDLSIVNCQTLGLKNTDFFAASPKFYTRVLKFLEWKTKCFISAAMVVACVF